MPFPKNFYEGKFYLQSKQSRSKMLQSDLIKKGETYTIWMKAVNDFGSSQMSEHTNITITGVILSNIVHLMLF